MIRAANGDAQSSIGWDTIKDRLNVGHDRAARWIRCATIVGEQKHERVRDASADHRANRRAVDINTRRASGIMVAELGDSRASKGMTKNSDTTQVKTPGELTGAVRR